jgi:pimeloyl-ACP methyl ester carboxylesterase
MAAPANLAKRSHPPMRTNEIVRKFSGLALSIQLFVATAAFAAAHDPLPSLKPAASMQEVVVVSGGARVNGLVYLAAGAGAHPVVVFLHGYPGNEKNLDLAQAVRREGYQAVYFDFRGLWGSGGTFSFANSLQDVQAIVDWVRAPEQVTRFHFDPRRIAIVGHSFGGWLALMHGAHEAQSVCVAGMAAWNVGWAGQRFASHEGERKGSLDYFRETTNPSSGPVRADAIALLNEMAAHPEWDYISKAEGLAGHAVLLVAATRDSIDEDVAMHERMAKAVRAAGGKRVKLVTYDDDHPFSSHRLALGDALIHWLNTDCRATQGR